MVCNPECSRDVFLSIWYNLYDIGGINSIKKVDKQNGSNPDTIYINGIETETIHSGTVFQYEGKIFGDTSRPCDIEFKKVYSYALNTETGEYESVEYEIPLMFIQEKCTEKFCEYYKSKNEKTITEDVTLSISAKDEETIKYGYHTLVEDYKKIKTLVTCDSIIAFCKD